MKQSPITLVTLPESSLRLASSQSTHRYVNHPSQDQQNLTPIWLQMSEQGMSIVMPLKRYSYYDTA